ncbi:hypothetical protein HDU91_001693, partial [Kappamyces sp. JEL0680]
MQLSAQEQQELLAEIASIVQEKKRILIPREELLLAIKLQQVQVDELIAEKKKQAVYAQVLLQAF